MIGCKLNLAVCNTHMLCGCKVPEVDSFDFSACFSCVSYSCLGGAQGCVQGGVYLQ